MYSNDLYMALSSGVGVKYFSVIAPMVLVNVAQNLANVESANAVGDGFDPFTSLLADAFITMASCFFGSPFPTTIYIGQPAFKAMGARTGYLVLNAVCIVLIATFNGAVFALQVFPVASGVGFLLWIGVLVTAQAFSSQSDDSVSSDHGCAVAFGLLPALAAWGWQMVQGAIQNSLQLIAGTETEADISLGNVMDTMHANGMYPFGMVALAQGYLLTSIVFASTLVHITEREFFSAGRKI